MAAGAAHFRLFILFWYWLIRLRLYLDTVPTFNIFKQLRDTDANRKLFKRIERNIYYGCIVGVDPSMN